MAELVMQRFYAPETVALLPIRFHGQRTSSRPVPSASAGDTARERSLLQTDGASQPSLTSAEIASGTCWNIRWEA
jgi:hypothetical protein